MTAEKYQELYNQYFKDLVNYSKVILKDEFLAEEVVQNIFTSLWKKEELTVKDYYPYLLISVRNNSLQNINAEKRREAAELHAHKFWVDQNSINKESKGLTIALIIDKLHLLPPKCKQVLALKIEDGLTNDEIADYLELSIKTVENQITIGYKKLRDILNFSFLFLGASILFTIL